MSSQSETMKRSTLYMPESLYEETKAIAAEQHDSINQIVISAVQSYVRALKHEQIDAAFAGMATDEKYRKQATDIAREFEESDWEALSTGAKER